MKIFSLKNLVFIAFSTIFINASANTNFKKERRIYAWDVTLSMKGYAGKTPDIYDEVVKALINDIKSINDEETEIIVIPFQDKILAEWKEPATEEGRNRIISNIRKFSNEDVTYTNICEPFLRVVNGILSQDKRDVLILLTDGEHNDVGQHSKESFYRFVSDWCSCAMEKDAYAFYVMLTEFATDEKLIDVLNNSCRMSLVKGTGFNFVELLPDREIIKYNVKDDTDKIFTVGMKCKKDINIPDNLAVGLLTEDNSYINVDAEVTVNDGNISFRINPLLNYEQLKDTLPQSSNESVKMKMILKNSSDNQLVSLMRDEITIELINKPEKTLKIYVRN